MKTQNRKKIIVVGAGRVGEAIAYTLVLGRQASEIVMIDIDKGRAEGSAHDIGHGLAYHSQVTIRQGGYEECADAAIIITAGLARKPGQTRLDLARTNVAIIKDITRNVMKYAENPIFVVTSNPVDIMTYVIQKESGVASSRVIGSGTVLDTARFRYILGKRFNINIEDVYAYVLGEHGDSQVLVWEGASIAGIPLKDYARQAGIDLAAEAPQIEVDVKTAGAQVISQKGATFYGIALNTAKIVAAIMDNDNAILPVGHVLTKEVYGIKDVVISVPCVINEGGIVRALEIPLAPEELSALRKSADMLKAFTGEVMAEDA
ncbi:L-lactate dehydrogenase [Parasphaerochaeta coccoides]|uniref:L-lactate dehydrogenase n=1 Tax=Parasphaerochaeta coccoides (strain ATCC BAA-1237 / DSM 17374 / SPN1) TaxID=760011 RepID=F4GKF8_PARC1|nr:L-lactate dehydrogenase [Parasphaerochaeta coccoides]AEC02841.1 L-lactate dehydrogenase [Parasphaerochaeta coccoides DSM 17374]